MIGKLQFIDIGGFRRFKRLWRRIKPRGQNSNSQSSSTPIHDTQTSNIIREDQLTASFTSPYIDAEASPTSYLRQKARILRDELREEERFRINLGLASRHDAQRMKKELDSVAIQLAREEIDLAQNGLSDSFIRNHMSGRKHYLLRRVGPGRCQLCGNEGQDNDKMVRVNETCGELGNERHWYHKSCLRRLFLTATENENQLPPKCCGKPIAEGYGHSVLSREEFITYTHKREEKHTVKRTYCPTCSYFFSPRIIERAINDRVNVLKKMERRPKGYISGSVACSKCKASICLLCKQLEHVGEDCAESYSDC